MTSRHGQALRKALAKAEASDASSCAKSVLGATTWNYLSLLFAQLGKFEAEERDLLFTLHAFGEGQREISFYYADLYPCLFPTDSSETVDGKLTSAARQRIRRRFDRLKEAEDRCGFPFIEFTPGTRNDDGKSIPSHVRLLSFDYIDEVESLAESDLKPCRNKQDRCLRAVKKFVDRKMHEKNSRNNKSLNKPKRLRDADSEIKNSWCRVQGNIRATVERMQCKNSTIDDIAYDLAQTIKNSLPTSLLEAKEFQTILRRDLLGEQSKLKPNNENNKLGIT